MRRYDMGSLLIILFPSLIVLISSFPSFIFPLTMLHQQRGKPKQNEREIKKEKARIKEERRRGKARVERWRVW